MIRTIVRRSLVTGLFVAGLIGVATWVAPNDCKNAWECISRFSKHQEELSLETQREKGIETELSRINEAKEFRNTILDDLIAGNITLEQSTNFLLPYYEKFGTLPRLCIEYPATGVKASVALSIIDHAYSRLGREPNKQKIRDRLVREFEETYSEPFTLGKLFDDTAEA